MREIRTSGLTSGDGKRSVAAWPKPPRPSSTLQVKGCKRHALVDTDGRALLLHAHPADLQNRDGAGPLLKASRDFCPFIWRTAHWGRRALQRLFPQLAGV